MNIRTFELERVQSLYENTVPYNLTESGFHPYTLEQLLSPDELSEMNKIVLGYGQTNGAVSLRQTISNLYIDFSEENILVTNGSSEANYVVCHTLLETGDEVVMMVPNYMQIWGIAEEMGCLPKPFHLKEENGWRPDLEELASLVNEKTKMIVICNPNNPTGYVLSKDEMTAIVTIAEKHGSWIFADEIYRGAELNGPEGISFAGMYDKAVVNGGLSKSYALPGLRIGWLAGPQSVIADCWAYHDYTSITTNMLGEYVAEIALKPEKRATILNRNRKMLRENLELATSWAVGYSDMISFIPPQAGGMLFLHYSFPKNSSDLSDWLRLEKGVFIVAGDVYGMDHHLRIGIGAEKEVLVKSFELVSEGFKELF